MAASVRALRLHRLLLLLALSLLLPLAARAERALTIDAVELNGRKARELMVRPGDTIAGTVIVSTSSWSLFKMHTGVWLPSWERTNPAALRVFLRSLTGGLPGVSATVEARAPLETGIHYLLFCFDKKDENEMFNELTARPNETIFANGRAIKIIVDEKAPPPPAPDTPAVTPAAPLADSSIAHQPVPAETSLFAAETHPLPAPFTVEKGKDFTAWLGVSEEKEFLVEVFTGWGDLGKLESVKLFAPDGRLLWNISPEGRGWEAKNIVSAGAGWYRILVSHSGEGKRFGRLDVKGLRNRSLRLVNPHPPSSTATGGVIDEEEREILTRLYKSFLNKGGYGVSDDEQKMIEGLEKYFREN